MRWLASEQADLALKVGNLDEVPADSLLPLAHLAANGSTDFDGLVAATNLEPERLNECLERLCEFGFAREDVNVYEATDAGCNAFDGLAKKAVIREVFELEGRLQYAKRLRKQLVRF